MPHESSQPDKCMPLGGLSLDEYNKVNEALFRCMMANEKVGFMICDCTGRLIEANETLLHMLQYTEEDLDAGHIHWQQMTPSEFIPRDLDVAKYLDIHGTHPPFEKQYIRRDGSLVDVLVMPSRIKDSHRFYVLCLILDISEQKQVERDLAETNRTLDQRVKERSAELQQTNVFLDSLIEHIPNIISVKEAKDLRYVRFNRASESMFGAPRQELIGKTDYELFPKEEADYLSQTDREAFAKGSIVEMPAFPTTIPNRGIRILQTKKIPLYDEHGQPQYLLGISEDITEQKNAEAERIELAKAQAAKKEAEKVAERLKILSTASVLLSSSLDFQSTLQNLMRSIVPALADWCAINTLTSEGDLELVALDYIHSQQGDPWGLHGFYPLPKTLEFGPRLVLRTGKTHLVYPITREQVEAFAGDQFRTKLLENIGMIAHLCVPLRTRSEIFGTISFITTKYSGRRYEQSDVQLAEELASRAALAMDNARLYQTSQNLNRLKDEFLATLSHELRTPLNVIQGFAEMLKDEGLQLSPEERLEYYEAIWRNSENQTRIMTDLLDVSAIISGKMNIDPQVIKPGKVACDIVRNFVASANLKGLEFHCHMDQAPASMIVDPTRFQQIIWNLASNAIKFTPEGGRIDITVSQKERSCCIEVKDTGIGVDPEFLPHIFERFRQEDSTVTRRYGGLGLGLSIVRHLVELHGGTVTAHSDGKGKGATFTVTLPLSTPRED